MPMYRHHWVKETEEDVKKKNLECFIAAFVLILFISLFILVACNIKDYPSDVKEYDVTNIDIVATGETAQNVTYVVDNWEISSILLNIEYGNYKSPTLQVQTYKTRIFKNIRFDSCHLEYKLCLPTGYTW